MQLKTLFVQALNMRKSHQRDIIARIKGFAGTDFSDGGVHRLSQQSADLSEIPLPPVAPPSAQSRTCAHTEYAYSLALTYSLARLNLDKPQCPEDGGGVLLVFLLSPFTFLSFPLTNVADRHLPCTDQIGPSCCDCSGAAPGRNTFWPAPGSPALLACTSPAFGGWGGHSQ